VDIFSRKAKLQDNKKVEGVILRIDKDGRIRYNHLQLVATYKELKKVYKSLKSF